MAVYVDPPVWPYRRMLMCHMWADTRDELLEMVDRIGVQRRWIQEPPKARWLHFDICKAKRKLAVALGAIETDRYGSVEHTARLRGDFHTVQRVQAVREKHQRDATGPLL